MGAFNQLNGAIFDAGAIEARISAVDGKGIYNQRDGATLDLDSLARRLTALDGKVAAGQGGIEFDVDAFMRRLAAIEAGGFNPLSLFAQGQQGVWYDPSDFSTMFQDSAGTTPVTAVGQPVGKLLDKSGRANHAIQATAANRPVLQQDANGMYYLAFNGTNSTLATAANVDLSGTAQVSVFAGVYKASDAAVAIITELSATSAGNAGAFYVSAPNTSAAGNYGFATHGIGVSATQSATPFAAPIASVLSAVFDNNQATSALQVVPRVNGATPTLAVLTGPTSAGNFGSYPLYIGARAGTSLFFNGRMYPLIVRGASSNGQEIVSAENWVNGKTRAY